MMQHVPANMVGLRPVFGYKPISLAVAASTRPRLMPGFWQTGTTLLLTAMFSFANPLQAATFTVTNTNDSGTGSLRQAVMQANSTAGRDDIVFSSSVTGSIKLTSGHITITDKVNIQGPGASALKIVGNEPYYGAFRIEPRSDAANLGTVNISDLTVQNPNSTAIDAFALPDSFSVRMNINKCAISGSAIGIEAYGVELNIRNSTLTDNRTGVSLHNNPAALISNSTVMHNGTGISHSYHASSRIEDSTISDNDYAGVQVHESGTMLSNSTVTGNGSGWVIEGGQDGGGGATILNSTISGNHGTGVGGSYAYISLENSEISDNLGAGLYNSGGFYASGGLNIVRSTISNNAGHGVGVTGTIAGRLQIQNSTISGNNDGGVFLSSYEVRASRYYDVTISNSTITGNSAGKGAGIFNANYHDQPITIINSIVAGNKATTDRDLSGAYFEVDYSLIQNAGKASITEINPGSNLFGMAPKLGPLQDNGGPTLTHALLNTSPAIDAIPNGVSGCGSTVTADQRGESRPLDGNADSIPACDMGAFEFSSGTTGGTGVIGDFVWLDRNGNGVQDGGEPGVAGVVVNLRVGCDSSNVLTTKTDSSGIYHFKNLPSNNYQLEFVKPAGYAFSPPIAAGDYTQDSNADPATGLDQCRSLGEGQRRSALDAGLIPAAAKVSLSVQDLVVPENVGTANVRVTLNSASSQTVTVNYATKPGTALPGKDYRGRVGTLTFKPGQTSKIVPVPILNDKVPEPTERFTIKIYTPVNANIADNVGAVNITDGD